MEWNVFMSSVSRLGALCKRLDRNNVGYTIMEKTYRVQKRQITSRQEDIVRAAFDLGFFEFPKRINLEGLSTRLGISIGAPSEILRRGGEEHPLEVLRFLLEVAQRTPKPFGDRDNRPRPPSYIGSEMSKLGVPESLKEEHEEFIEGLKRHSEGKDQTSATLRQLLRLLESHIESENEIVLPLLGAFGSLVAGDSLENPGAVMRAYEKYAGQYGNMFAEHSPIRQSIKEARRLAKEGGQEDVVEILDALAHHTMVEEEVLYPAALLVGKTAPQLRPAAAQGESRASAAATAESTDHAGRMPYFALDYEASISSVTKRLIVKHDEIKAILWEVGELADKGKLNVAISLLSATSPLILRSAVEEEARVMRVVMQKNKSRAQLSVDIEREHRDITDFLMHRLPELSSEPTDEARRDIIAFVSFTCRHLRQEEEVPFAIAAAGTWTELIEEPMPLPSGLRASYYFWVFLKRAFSHSPPRQSQELSPSGGTKIGTDCRSE